MYDCLIRHFAVRRLCICKLKLADITYKFSRACIVQTLQYVRIQLVERKFVDFVVIHFFLLLLSLFADDQGSSVCLCLFVITPLK